MTTRLRFFGLKDSPIDYSQIQQESSYDFQKALQEAAYYNWINAGRPEGRELEFWADAERQVFGYTSDEYYDAMEEVVWDDGNLGGYSRSSDVFLDGASQLEF